MKYWKSMAAGAAVMITPMTAFAGDSMQLGERLQAGQALTSPNGTFSAKMGNDCQFGVYAKMANPNLPPRALWTSKSKNKGQGCYLELQKVNGHLVVFDKNRSGKWSTGLYKKPPGNRKLTLDNSGDLILRENGKKIWSTKTASAPTGSSSAKKNSLYMGGSLKGGESLVTRDGAYKAVMHKNCNFVLYKTQGNQTLWSTKTANRGKNCRLDLQKKDGNLVIYDGPKKVIWATNKYSAFPGSRSLTISGSGNMAVQKGSEIIWQTHTAQNGRARSVGAVTLPGKGAYLKQISDGKVKAWVWQKSSGDQHLFYENSRTDTEIALQEANVRFKASINLRNKTFTTSQGHSAPISGTSVKPSTFRDIHFLEISNKILAAYYADGNDVYGGSDYSCSGGDPTFKDLFKPACEEHDRYYNAPWVDLLGPWTFYTQKDKVLEDRWESKTEIALATKEVIESTFRDHMGDICEDLDLSVRIASGGFCDTAKVAWYNSLLGWGSFFGNQHGVSEKTKKDPDYLPIVFNMPVREIKPIIMAASKKVSIRGGGNDFEVEIDCNVSGADDETTTDRITVEFFNKHNRSIGKRHSNGVGSCLTDKSFSASLNDVPAYIEVQTNGSDGYMIDELWIRKNGEDIAKHGADNDRGWCLSTDPADAGGSWRNSVAGQCQRSHRFSVNASKAKLAYSVGIDCLVSGADDEETSNRITVRWYSADGRDLGAKHRNGISTCHGANDTWSIELNEPAAYVTVSTNGSDGYLMDQIEMFVGDEEVREHGGNDSRGWCLSTDNGDHNRGNFYGHSVDSKCPPTRRFDY